MEEVEQKLIPRLRGAELQIRLRAFLAKCIERQTRAGASEKVAALESALALATEGSITHELRQS